MNSVQLPEATIIYCFIISNVLVYDPKTFEETSQPKPKQGMVCVYMSLFLYCHEYSTQLVLGIIPNSIAHS